MPRVFCDVPSQVTGTEKANGTPPFCQMRVAARSIVSRSITCAGWSGEPPMMAMRGALASSRSYTSPRSQCTECPSTWRARSRMPATQIGSFHLPWTFSP